MNIQATCPNDAAPTALSQPGAPDVSLWADYLPDVICLLDEEGRFVQVNAAAKTLWGYDPEELKGRCITDLVAEEDRQRTGQAVAGTRCGPPLRDFLNDVTGKDGHRKPTIWSVQWQAGQNLFYGVARNGSYRCHVEQKAAREEQRLQRAYKLARLAWWEWNHASTQLTVSDELYTLYGLNPADYPNGFSAEVFLSLVHSDDLPQVLKHWEAIHKTSFYQYDHRLLKPGGEVVYIHHYIHTIKDKDGRVTATHGTAQDITQSKRTEQALKGSQSRLEDIVESLGDGFYALDRNWNFTYWNKKAEEITGIRRETVVGKHAWDLYPEVKELRLYHELKRVLEEGGSAHFQEYIPLLRMWIEVSAYPSPDGLSVYVRDVTQQKQSEEESRQADHELQQARRNLQQVLESMSDGFYTIDRDWTITFATDRIAAMIGVRKEDYIGRNHWKCFPKSVSRQFYSQYHRALSENTLVTFEEFLPSYNLWVEINAYPTQDGLSVYVKDITERRRQEKRLEFMAKATSEVIWERALDSTTVEINGEKIQQLFGYEVTGNTIDRSFWLEHIHPDDVDVIDANREQALQHGLDFYLNEYRFRKADGSWAYVKNRTYVVRNGEGKPIALIGAVRDVTAKRLSEKALVESEQSYRQLFDNAPLAKVISDAETLRILAVNSEAVELFGYSREELLGMTILDLHPSDLRQEVKQGNETLEPGIRNRKGTVTTIKRGGEEILVEISVISTQYKGRPAALATIQDVTERVRLQQLLVKQEVNHQRSITKAAIEAQEKERSEIGRELHDNVNQVLVSAKLYVENIRYYPEQSEAFLEKGTSLLQRSINEIRRLSKALVTPTIRDAGFKDALQELVTSYKELDLFKVECACEVEIEQLDPELCLTIYRILQEAFNNTIKYAHASLVQVGLERRGGLLHLSYHDDGVGFDPAGVKKGIGLNNIRNRAEAYRGKVSIESAPGSGCRLHISFPVEGAATS